MRGDRQVKVRIERVEVWQSCPGVRAMTEMERGVLQRTRGLFGNEEVVIAEVKMVDGLLHGLGREGWVDRWVCGYWLYNTLGPLEFVCSWIGL